MQNIMLYQYTITAKNTFIITKILRVHLMYAYFGNVKVFKILSAFVNMSSG